MNFAKYIVAHNLAKFKYFVRIPSKWYILCLCYAIDSQMNCRGGGGGGGRRTP